MLVSGLGRKPGTSLQGDCCCFCCCCCCCWVVGLIEMAGVWLQHAPGRCASSEEAMQALLALPPCVQGSVHLVPDSPPAWEGFRAGLSSFSFW